MDTNQPPVVPSNPEPQVIPVQTQGVSGGGNKKLLIITVILAVLIVLAGGLIYLRNSNLLTQSKPAQTAVTVFDDLKTELESTDVGASESDLSEFDKDLNSL